MEEISKLSSSEIAEVGTDYDSEIVVVCGSSKIQLGSTTDKSTWVNSDSPTVMLLLSAVASDDAAAAGTANSKHCAVAKKKCNKSFSHIHRISSFYST